MPRTPPMQHLLLDASAKIQETQRGDGVCAVVVVSGRWMGGSQGRVVSSLLTPLSRSPLRQTARIQQRGFLDCSTPSPRTTTLARCTRSGWIACLSVVGEVVKFAVWQEPAKQRGSGPAPLLAVLLGAKKTWMTWMLDAEAQQT